MCWTILPFKIFERNASKKRSYTYELASVINVEDEATIFCDGKKHYLPTQSNNVWSSVSHSLHPWSSVQQSTVHCCPLNQRNSSLLSSPSFKHSFQFWWTARSIACQTKLQRTCARFNLILNPVVNQHRLTWFSTINKALEEIEPGLFTKSFFSRLLFHSTYRVRMHSASLIFRTYSISYNRFVYVKLKCPHHK